MTTSAPVFATYAPGMREQQLAVVPIGPGRKPYVNSFNQWRYRPGAKIVDRWCEQFGAANIGVLPGLSGKGATVFDCDSQDAVAEVEDRFGRSDLHVVTRRAAHLWYDKVPFRLPGNLRKFGLDVDIKAGHQIVIAPPSVHDSGHVYRLDGCDWSALNKLRKLDTDKLHQFIHGLKQQQAKREVPEPRDDRELRDDSRGLCINDTVFGYALGGASMDEALAMGRRLNDGFAAHPRGKLLDDEVFDRAMKAWQDAQSGKFKSWGRGRRAVVRTTRDEIERLPGDALKLLSKLRADHTARCERGETFAIPATAMAKAKIMSRHRIERARTILLREHLIVQVAPMMNTAAGRVPAQYRLVLVSPSQGGGTAAGAV